jgi:NAD(P)-dependent dehydrogenase (short-subunit alcohol dehydrogenase family)
MSTPFAGKVAVVTGSTQGLGEAIARHLVGEKMVEGLVLCGRNAERGRRVAEEISQAGCTVEFVTADLARAEDCLAVVDAGRKAFGRIDYLVNSAATSERGTILDTSPALFDRMFAVNTRAPFFLMQGAAKIMRHEGTPGAMVNVVSMSGHGGQPFLCPYSASKGALITLTRNVAFSLMRDHIRVNALNIGWMNTPGEASIQKSHHNAEDDWLEKAMQQQPFGRLLEPQEVARAVAFLCSDESGLMTGSIIDFDQSVLGSYEETPQPAARLTD